MPTDFKTWDRTVLERFAAEASDRLREQRAQLTDMLAEQARLHAEIAALRSDLRAAMDAYRALVTSTPRPAPSRTS
jgi:ABC-type transporter Mla subunit MlaD